MYQIVDLSFKTSKSLNSGVITLNPQNAHFTIIKAKNVVNHNAVGIVRNHPDKLLFLIIGVISFATLSQNAMPVIAVT